MTIKIPLLLAGLATAISANAQASQELIQKHLGAEKSPRLQSLSIANNGNVWASGTKGLVVVSSDNGSTWQTKPVPNSDDLQFRDIWAQDDTVYLLAAGEGEKSQLYRSNDNGDSWQLQYTMKNPKGFINCFDFWSKDHGIVFGDSIDDKVFMLETKDGGKNWNQMQSVPLAQEGGEGGFSASGSCVRIGSDNEVWVSTGATKHARLLRSSDYGQTWNSTPLPYPDGKTAGLFSAIPNSKWTFGGRMNTPVVTGYKLNEGQWQPTKNIGLKGAIYGSDSYGDNVIVVNPDGAALSTDNGKNWQRISDKSFWVVEFDKQGTAWLAGPQGRISSISFNN
ncbi:MAG: WD40/YVTN/BNR-like repeat-containing protein [Psychrobium sp.]